jgi:hypothetical protein
VRLRPGRHRPLAVRLHPATHSRSAFLDRPVTNGEAMAEPEPEPAAKPAIGAYKRKAYSRA